MTNYKFILSNDENTESNKSSTTLPAQNRKRHKPIRGVPKDIY